MHIEITPKRQSFPLRFISCNNVATHRAPVYSRQTLLAYTHIANYLIKAKLV